MYLLRKNVLVKFRTSKERYEKDQLESEDKRNRQKRKTRRERPKESGQKRKTKREWSEDPLTGSFVHK